MTQSPDLRDLIARTWFTVCDARHPSEYDGLDNADRNWWLKDAEAFQAAFTAAGFAIVPRETTEAMMKATFFAFVATAGMLAASIVGVIIRSWELAVIAGFAGGTVFGVTIGYLALAEEALRDKP